MNREKILIRFFIQTHLMLRIFLFSIIYEVFTKQIFDAAIMQHAVKSKWFNINPDDLDIAVYESQKIHGMTPEFDVN